MTTENIEVGDKISWMGARKHRCTGYVHEIDGDTYYVITYLAAKKAVGGFKAPKYKKRLEDLTLVIKKADLDNGTTYETRQRKAM